MKILSTEKINQIPHVILFDLDNTLYSYQAAHEQAMENVSSKVMKTLGISLSQFEKVYDEAKTQIKKQLGLTASSHSRLLYFQRMLEILGLGSQVLLALDFEQTYWRTFFNNAELFDGVKEFLDEIRILGISTAIVTDLTAQIQFRKIIYFGLEQYVDYIVTSEECQFDKPYSGMFELALNKIKPKGRCIWMIGDNPVNDIFGAKKSIQALTFQKYHQGVSIGKDENMPDVVFKDFYELKHFLTKIVKNINVNPICEVVS